MRAWISALLVAAALVLWGGSSPAQEQDLEALLEDLGGEEEVEAVAASGTETEGEIVAFPTVEVEAAPSEIMGAETALVEGEGEVPEASVSAGVPVEVPSEEEAVEEAKIEVDETGMPGPEAEAEEEVPAGQTGEAAAAGVPPEEESAAVEMEEEAVEAEVMAPESEEAQRLVEQERVRRQALEVKGLKELEAGYRLLEQGQFSEARQSFSQALQDIPERPATMGDIRRAHWGHAEADYRLALELYRKREKLEEAAAHLESALRHAPDHEPAARLLKKVQVLEEKLAELAKRPVAPRKRPEYRKRTGEIKTLLKEGRQFYEIGDLDAAEAAFDRVLAVDKYNADAMRFLKKIEERREKISTYHLETTRQKALRKVRESWSPPIRKEVELPPEVARREVIKTQTAAERLREKMSKIIIPEIEFRQANIRDVVNFLVEASIAGDPEGHGVNIVLNLPSEAAETEAPPAPALEEELPFFGEEAAPAPPPAPTEGTLVPSITLNLRRIALLDALKIITEVAGLRYRIEGNVVVITPVGFAAGPIVTRMYPVQPSILDVIIERQVEEARAGEFVEMAGAETKIRRADVKEFFERAGVPFPKGTSITYNPAISHLIVANTPENLEIFERILAQLNVVPRQVEIEAKFVEIAEDRLEELGLEWILTDNWELATKRSAAPVSGRERIQVDADTAGFTKGLRFFGWDRTTATISPASAVTRSLTRSALGNILSISTILTNPEVRMILHALSQRGAADLLSAPRVTTRSGVNAQIQVVREIIYPTEFEVTQPTIQSEGNLVTPPTVTPGGFETRETGVILNVTPTVGPDGYTIDLTLVPEVSELVGWIQYGSEVTLPIGDEGGDRTFVFNIPQPIFSSRSVTTSIVLWDGQTVVMGGLIREDVVKVRDKVPLLGDIPLLGRLFRSEGERSQKRNLLIFVTARLVDPAGNPIHKAPTMPISGGAPVSTGGEIPGAAATLGVQPVAAVVPR
ncbi:MAG TPA: hypothetical protein EYP62_09285 [Kiritimatiellae bacterium]|nr:hypothetical protein [Kiritimatiellia bacterium]